MHAHWRHAAITQGHSGDLRAALLAAQSDLRVGQWAAHVIEDFTAVGLSALPGLLSGLCDSTLTLEAQARDARNPNRDAAGRQMVRQMRMLEQDWGLCRNGDIEAVEALRGALQRSPGEVARSAINHLLGTLQTAEMLQRARRGEFSGDTRVNR